MKTRHYTVSILILFFSSFALSGQVTQSENALTKKELRAKKKKAKEVEKVNNIKEVRREAKALLEAKDFVVKDDGRSGASGAISFFKIHGDTVSIQTWTSEAVGTVVNYREGSNRVIGDILTYEIQDNGPDQPLQAFIIYVDRLTFAQELVSVYVYGKRIEAGGIRGYFSNVADANIWESGIMTSGRRAIANRTR